MCDNSHCVLAALPGHVTMNRRCAKAISKSRQYNLLMLFVWKYVYKTNIPHVIVAATQICSQLQQKNAQAAHIAYVVHWGSSSFSNDFLNGNNVGKNATKGHRYTIIVTRYPAEPWSVILYMKVSNIATAAYMMPFPLEKSKYVIATIANTIVESTMANTHKGNCTNQNVQNSISTRDVHVAYLHCKNDNTSPCS